MYYATTTSPQYKSEEIPPWSEDYNENQQIIVHHAPPTLEPFPTVATHRPQVIYENYDTKYNVYDSEPEPKNPELESEGGFPSISEHATPGTVLVIGIIAGALIAIVLIVIIVLKMRTRTEQSFKVEQNVAAENRTYQFAQNQQQQKNSELLTPLNQAPTEVDTGFETPSIVGINNLPGTKATVIPASNGFYEKYVNNNKKKPVREWYV